MTLMKLTIPRDDDALSLGLDDTAIIESEEVSEGIVLDNAVSDFRSAAPNSR